MIGECNCACMPVQNLFGRAGLFLYAFPVFCWVVSFSFLGFSTSVFPRTILFCFSFFFQFSFCVVITVLCLCVVFFPFCSVLFLNFLSVNDVGPFVVHLFVGFVFLLKNDAALLLESRSANANAE